jgi:hypothetical protein
VDGPEDREGRGGDHRQRVHPDDRVGAGEEQCGDPGGGSPKQARPEQHLLAGNSVAERSPEGREQRGGRHPDEGHDPHGRRAAVAERDHSERDG